jgi:hypothetical protein
MLNQGSEARFEILAVNASGEPLAMQGLEYRLVEERIHYQWYREFGHWQYRREVRERDQAHGTLDVLPTEPAVLAFSLDWGRYRLDVRDPATGALGSARVQLGWGGTATPEDTPDRLRVTHDRSAYLPGSEALLSIEGTFDGPGQVVIATDRVLEVLAFELQEGRARVPRARAGRMGRRRLCTCDGIPAGRRAGWPGPAPGDRGRLAGAGPGAEHAHGGTRRPRAVAPLADPGDRRRNREPPPGRTGVRDPGGSGRGAAAVDGPPAATAGHALLRPAPAGAGHPRPVRAPAGRTARAAGADRQRGREPRGWRRPGAAGDHPLAVFWRTARGRTGPCTRGLRPAGVRGPGAPARGGLVGHPRGPRERQRDRA